MKTVKVADRVSVGSQPSEADLAQLAAAGIQVVVNLRREGEENQPLTPEAEAEVARAHGLAYHHVPVSLNGLRPEQVTKLRGILQASPGPALVHCGAGQRAGSGRAAAPARCRRADGGSRTGGVSGHRPKAARVFTANLAKGVIPKQSPPGDGKPVGPWPHPGVYRPRPRPDGGQPRPKPPGGVPRGRAARHSKARPLARLTRGLAGRANLMGVG